MLNVETFLVHDVENKEIYQQHDLNSDYEKKKKKKENIIPDPDIISLNTICKSTGKTVD